MDDLTGNFFVASEAVIYYRNRQMDKTSHEKTLARRRFQSVGAIGKGEFGLALVEIRRQRGLLQKQVALDACIDPSYLAALERGRRNPPTLEVLDRLIAALNASAAEERRIRASAASTRMGHLITKNFDSLRNARLMRALATALPNLDEPAVEALSSMLFALSQQSLSPPPIILED